MIKEIINKNDLDWLIDHYKYPDHKDINVQKEEENRTTRRHLTAEFLHTGDKENSFKSFREKNIGYSQILRMRMFSDIATGVQEATKQWRMASKSKEKVSAMISIPSQTIHKDP